ncbi:MAG: DUF3990 domain-containing protein [Gemmataceae bacterium]
MPLPGVPFWTDQDIDLYHGTLDAHVASILQGVNLTKCGALRDFSRGFYTTTNRKQAEHWAQGLSHRSRGAAPAVIRFMVERNNLAMLETLVFVRGTAAAVDYWSFVQFCRTSATDHGRVHTLWYDLVAGPVMGSLRKQTVILDGDQFSFHTPRAVAVLDNSKKVEVL